MNIFMDPVLSFLISNLHHLPSFHEGLVADAAGVRRSPAAWWSPWYRPSAVPITWSRSYLPRRVGTLRPLRHRLTLGWTQSLVPSVYCRGSICQVAPFSNSIFPLNYRLDGRLPFLPLLLAKRLVQYHHWGRKRSGYVHGKGSARQSSETLHLQMIKFQRVLAPDYQSWGRVQSEKGGKPLPGDWEHCPANLATKRRHSSCLRGGRRISSRLSQRRCWCDPGTHWVHGTTSNNQTFVFIALPV